MGAPMRPLCVRLILVACLGWVPSSLAQDFPSKPVHIVVPVQGGTMDLKVGDCRVGEVIRKTGARAN